MSEVTKNQEKGEMKSKTVTVKLKVAIATFGDSGRYNIKVTNTHGEDTADISVAVHGQFFSLIFLSFLSHLTSLCKYVY